MKNSYTAAAAQFEPVSENCAANMEKMLKLCDRAADAGASLIVFPELALTGYYLKADVLRSLAVPAEGEWSRPLREKAAARQMMIAVGYPEREAAHAGAAGEPSCGGAGRAPGESSCARAGRAPGEPSCAGAGRAPGESSYTGSAWIYNSCLLIGTNGESIGNARKRYLWGREKRIFTPGDSYEVFRTELGAIAPLLCYDLEFPEPARIAMLKGADLILCPAAWSRKAEHRWRVETAANALFNLVYLVGSNFVDENCCGAAMILSPEGKVLAETAGEAGKPGKAGEAEAQETDLVVTAEISFEELRRCREEIPYHRDFNPRILSEALRETT